MSDTLNKWEAEAKEEYKIGLDGIGRQKQFSKRILALIDLVRKKDKALQFALDLYEPHHPVVKVLNPIPAALALTEKLK